MSDIQILSPFSVYIDNEPVQKSLVRGMFTDINENFQALWNLLGDGTTLDANIITQTEQETALDPQTHVVADITDLFDNVYSETEVDTLLNGKSDTGHTHTVSDITDLYDNVYSESEVDALLTGKANSSHTHTVSDITDLYDNVYSETETDNLLDDKEDNIPTLRLTPGNTVTLPSSPSDGDRYIVVAIGDFSSSSGYIDPDGNDIAGSSSNFEYAGILDVTFYLQYDNTSGGWAIG